MPKYIFQGMMSLLVITLIQGCASTERETEHYKIKSYIQEKERVDQVIDTAKPIGNWSNAPLALDPERKPTRKMYILEVTEKTEPVDESIYETDVDTSVSDNIQTTTTKTTRTNVHEAPNIQLPDFDEMAIDNEDALQEKEQKVTSYTNYKVEKDDTLQKVSKKFYDTYRKWPQIYEANRSVIKNPNFIKPGITIRIPVEK